MRMGRFSVDLLLANNRDLILAQEGSLPPENVRQVRCRGLVDPGATRLVLPESVVNQLGLPAAGETEVRYADHRTARRKRVKDVWLQLQNREGTFSATVEPDRTDALVGAIVLEELDFVVDNITQKLHPRDPNWIISEAE
jgi:predicted aspartyl protease